MTMNKNASFSNANLAFRDSVPATKKPLPKLFFVLIAVIISAIALELLVYFVIYPLSTSREIIFTGVSKKNEDYYRAQCEKFLSRSWFRFNESDASRFFYENFPNIESVSVQKVFPSQIFVDIQERQAVASSIVLINGESVPILIDRKGVVFQIGGNVAQANLPLLSGLTFDELKIGARLHEKLQPLMERLAEIANINPAYLQSISEIKVVPKNYGSFDLIVYPVNSRVRVLVDRNFSYETLQYMLVMLDVIGAVDTNVYEVDLRYGAVSYKKY